MSDAEEFPTREMVRRYRLEAAPQPPRALDYRVLRALRGAPRPRRLLPLAFAASVLLALGALWIASPAPPGKPRGADRPYFMRAAARTEITADTPDTRRPRLYSSDPPQWRDAER